MITSAAGSCSAPTAATSTSAAAAAAAAAGTTCSSKGTAGGVDSLGGVSGGAFSFPALQSKEMGIHNYTQSAVWLYCINVKDRESILHSGYGYSSVPY